ncbi:phosphoserine aminotransferase [Halobacteriovorax marinus]|uniref:aminotransferase class V-fold PLP-dependent enzyme n=1 Tax=Halobacteriovorax marinus TaxID=97084 RepID=UPI000BC2C8FD|nr:aminotransferase class V-fold PLP-dependent enzyme [Halobacteriovorax marinus]ATH08342.1 phosphoserine aminotransferase [Halobacteriovorax marinus]
MFENYKTPQELRPSDPRFGCGPSLVPVEFLEKLAATGNSLIGTSHRKPAVKNLVKEVQEGLATYFNIPSDYRVVLGNGGATFLFDMIALGLVRKKAAHFTCGEFSQKWFKSSKAVPWIEAEEFKSEYGQGMITKDVTGADLIATTLNETSTGVQIDGLPDVGEDTLLCVDATSGAGQVPCDISKTDVFFFSPQKVFASEGGLWVAIMSPKAIARSKEIESNKERYIPGIMSWDAAISNGEKNQTYNTPSISTIFFLNEQVKLMNEFGGYDKAIKYAQDKADLIYGWATEKPYLSPYVGEEKFRSTAVATIDVDDKYDASALIKVFEKEGSVNGIDAYRKLGRNQFRISLFHNVKIEDLEKLTKMISMAIEA